MEFPDPVQVKEKTLYDRKALFAKGSRKSDEFKHPNGFFSYFS